MHRGSSSLWNVSLGFRSTRKVENHCSSAIIFLRHNSLPLHLERHRFHFINSLKIFDRLKLIFDRLKLIFDRLKL